MNAREMTAKLRSIRRILGEMESEAQQAMDAREMTGSDWAERTHYHGRVIGLRTAVQLLDASIPGLAE